MRNPFLAIATPVVFLLVLGVFPDRVGAADVAPPAAYGPPPYSYGPAPDYGPPPPLLYRPLPYAVARPACGPRWQCGPLGCAWRQVCYSDGYVRPYLRPDYYRPY
jgi:hypothetical protein